MSAPARARSRGRKPGTTSVAIAVAARKAGKQGGRPRDQMPAEIIASLGAPPKDPAGIRIWNARLVAEATWLAAQGLIGDELAARIRAGATVVIKALPAIVRDDESEEDPDDDEDHGPELARTSGDPPLHG